MEYGECMKYLKKRRFNGIFASLFLLICCSLTSCFSFEYNQYINEFEIETDESAIERMRDWSIDLPDDTLVVSRYHAHPECYDCGFWSAYYIFEVCGDYSFDTDLVSTDFASFEAKWDYLRSSDWLGEESEWPNFNTAYSSLIIARLKDEVGARENQDNTDSNSYYSVEYLSSDKYYGRRQHVGKYVFVGKAYIILQENRNASKYIYAFFSIDNLEVKSYKVD